ncbi:MAG TPA: acetoacetate decarboxylase family protein [Burkholderiaceae bacterium]|nr:acetoacetate decarboxylase family protein [Burkholderiaceae bacterium]
MALDGSTDRYPSAPWRLRGDAALHVQPVAAAAAARFVPPSFAIVPIAPGLTLGAVGLAEYGAGSTLRYRELLVVAALVRHRGKLGAWISHIYVDEPRSQDAGREIWGLPKEIARFDDDLDARTTVWRGATPLCVMTRPSAAATLRLPLFAPVLSLLDRRALWFQGVGSARCRIGRSEIHVPAHSPLAELGFDRGWRIDLTDLDLIVPPPRRGRRELDVSAGAAQ